MLVEQTNLLSLNDTKHCTARSLVARKFIIFVSTVVIGTTGTSTKLTRALHSPSLYVYSYYYHKSYDNFRYCPIRANDRFYFITRSFGRIVFCMGVESTCTRLGSTVPCFYFVAGAFVAL